MNKLLMILSCRRHFGADCAQRERGFTLVELMVTITVFAILLAIALPAFQALIRNNRLAAASSEVQNAFSLARNEAITRRQFVTVCPSANTDTATPACSGNWGNQNGILVFADNGGTPGAVDNGERIFKIVQLNPSITITPNNATSFQGNAYIRFSATGVLGTAPASGGTLMFCDSRTGNFGRYLRVLPVGMAQASRQQLC